MPCCFAVANRLASTTWVLAPRSLRLQPPVLRTTTAGRSARSARLLVGSSPSMSRKVNKCLLCFLNRLASRALSGSVKWRSSAINASSLSSNSLRRAANASGVSSPRTFRSFKASRNTESNSRGNLTAPRSSPEITSKAPARCAQSTSA